MSKIAFILSLAIVSRDGIFWRSCRNRKSNNVDGQRAS